MLRDSRRCMSWCLPLATAVGSLVSSTAGPCCELLVGSGLWDSSSGEAGVPDSVSGDAAFDEILLPASDVPLPDVSWEPTTCKEEFVSMTYTSCYMQCPYLLDDEVREIRLMSNFYHWLKAGVTRDALQTSSG